MSLIRLSTIAGKSMQAFGLNLKPEREATHFTVK